MHPTRGRQPGYTHNTTPLPADPVRHGGGTVLQCTATGVRALNRRCCRGQPQPNRPIYDPLGGGHADRPQGGLARSLGASRMSGRGRNAVWRRALKCLCERNMQNLFIKHCMQIVQPDCNITQTWRNNPRPPLWLLPVMPASAPDRASPAARRSRSHPPSDRLTRVAGSRAPLAEAGPVV